MDISGVLPLPSPSSSRHCQKQATAVTPTVLQHSNINILCIQLPKNRHRKTEQPIPSKTEPRMARNCITRALTRWLKFLPHEHALHAPPRAPTRQSTLTHAPHVPAAASLPTTSALGDVTLPRQHTSAVYHWLWSLTLIVDRWLWPLTVDFDHSQNFSTWPVLLSFSRRFRFWALFLHLRSLNPIFGHFLHYGSTKWMRYHPSYHYYVGWSYQLSCVVSEYDCLSQGS